MSKIIAIVSLVLILFLVNWSIFHKERQLAAGGTVYLELAPVDPRSLMQGDYMALRFRLADEVYRALLQKEEAESRRNEEIVFDGRAVVKLDERKVGSFERLYEDQDLAEDELLIRFRVRNGLVKLATNAFFFQEGHGNIYEPAKYGLFRVDDKGELLLVALYDENLKKLDPGED
ncbi:MAG: GDYXXLXY domain-containing protein [Syntrophotaleaceae bacterium]